MQPEKKGYFGDYGGQFVPETLMPVLDELADMIFQVFKAGIANIIFAFL